MPCEAWGMEHSTSAQLKKELDKVTDLLCDTLRRVDQYRLRDDVHIELPNRVEAWWAKHKKDDEEQQRKKQEEERLTKARIAYNKLTPEERELLKELGDTITALTKR